MAAIAKHQYFGWIMLGYANSDRAARVRQQIVVVIINGIDNKVAAINFYAFADFGKGKQQGIGFNGDFLPAIIHKLVKSHIRRTVVKGFLWPLVEAFQRNINSTVKLFKIAMKGLDGGRINIATCSLGTAQAAINRAQAYMLEREQFGQSISNFQALQFKLADMVTELVAARQMVRLAAFKVDTQHSEAAVYSAMAKRFATDVGFEVCNEALQLHGGYGYMREYPLERYIRDTRVHQILEGTNEVMRLIVSRRLLTMADVELIQ